MAQRDRTLQETTTFMSPSEIISAAKRFFAV